VETSDELKNYKMSKILAGEDARWVALPKPQLPLSV